MYIRDQDREREGEDKKVEKGMFKFYFFNDFRMQVANLHAIQTITTAKTMNKKEPNKFFWNASSNFLAHSSFQFIMAYIYKIGNCRRRKVQLNNIHARETKFKYQQEKNPLIVTGYGAI